MQQNTILSINQKRFILDKINLLPPDKVAQVADFVDFISKQHQERQLTQAIGEMAENTFKEVWDNPEDDAYDRI